MKAKIFLMAAFIMTIATASFAQKNSVRFGVHGGASYANASSKSDGIKYSATSIFGAQAGIVADILISKSISFQPGLNFVQKGTKISYESLWDGSDETETLHLNCLEMPFNILYNARNKKGNFFAGGGPSLTYTLSGKYQYKENGENQKESLSIGNDEMEDDIRALDFGLNLMAGYEFKSGVFIAANYNFGLRNLTPGGDSDYKTNCSYAGLRFGYFFGRK